MMLKKMTLFLLAMFLFQSVDAQSLGGFLKKAKKVVKDKTDVDLGATLSTSDIGKGLKEALSIGVGEASDFLSVENGYYKSAYKIPVPKEAQSLIKKLKVIPGFSDFEEKLTKKINRAAEAAAVKAKPIFINAIKQMTIKDATNLLMGEKDAATRYLEKTTYDNLYAEFKPIIIKALEEANALSYWKTGVTAHNKLPFVKKANPNLDDYVAKKALVALFNLVEKKEEDIRKNSTSRTSDLLKKVFEKQDKE